MSAFFRPVADTEIDEAHSVYLGVVDWLKAKGVRQWLRVLPADIFEERQARGERFAGRLQNRIAAIVTVAFETDPDWSEIVGPEKNWWIKTLAVSRTFCGQDIGGQLMKACETHLIQSGARVVWLECVEAGFLPDYYARLGYELIKGKTITYPSGNTFPVALMRKIIGGPAAGIPGRPRLPR